ncbi:MAG: histidine kinase [Akkermansiaceae bacterium]
MSAMKAIWLLGAFVGNVFGIEPYLADPFTLHLWHLNEEKAPFLNSSPTGEFPLEGQFNGAVSQPSSLPGFGNAISFHHNTGGVPRGSNLKGAIVTLSPILANGADDNAPLGFRYTGESGAFTYEALLKLNILPGEAEGIALGLITIEGDRLPGSSIEILDEPRAFHFRIERDGFLMFNPLLGSKTFGGAMATIPTEGPHRINTENWFHVAVSYSGEEGLPGNIQLYWTSLADAPEQANLIGSGMLSSDFSKVLGDFAIGNEARDLQERTPVINAEAEPFPGLLDEIRISSVARHPTDFLFVEPDQRIDPILFREQRENSEDSKGGSLVLQKFWVDGKEHPLPSGHDELVKLGKGTHRLDFDFGFKSNQGNESIVIRSQLEGVDRVWRNTGQGMTLVFELLDESGAVLSESQHSVLGRSVGWNGGLEDSELTPWIEPLFVPEGARRIRVKFSSGPPDTTGYMALDNLKIIFSGSEKSIWPNGNFENGRHRQSRSGLPDYWQRRGSNLAIPQALNTNNNLLIALIDGDQVGSGEWWASIEIPSEYHNQRTAIVRWKEAYNVIEGAQYRSTYLNVPSGEYVFRAMATSREGVNSAHNIEFSFDIPISVTDQPWFRSAVIGGVIFLIVLYLFDYWRRLHRRRLRAAEFEHRLERDRSRIASNLHDDLGTRATVIGLAASLAAKEVSRDPERANRHLNRLKSSTRGLTLAMDELVWAVDPAHDALEHLASYLIRVSDEVFSGSEIKCRIDIPEQLPFLVFRSEYRHHIILSVKEAFHNVLKHSKATEVRLSLAVEEPDLMICIADNGSGFENDSCSSGSGLGNFKRRLDQIGGSSVVKTSPGKGTSVIFRSPLDQL